jgi:hypothetical protein
MRQVIQPIIADAYSEKKFRIIGTPNLFTNPYLERNWKDWMTDSEKPNSEYGFIRVDWIRGVKEGCIDEKYVLKQKSELPPDEFAMEYEAKFPLQMGRFFPIEILDNCVDRASSFKEIAEKKFDYIMSVDFARFRNKTQILVGEVNTQAKTIRYVNWVEIDPKREKIDYENQIKKIKDLFWQYDCVWICPDATSNQDALMRMLVTGEDMVPEGLIYKTGERTGYCASDMLNHELWKNHRQQLIKGRIFVPYNGAREQRLTEEWKREHNELEAQTIRNGMIVKLTEPKNGYKDLAVTSAMMSLYIQVIEKGKASLGIGTWKQ